MRNQRRRTPEGRQSSTESIANRELILVDVVPREGGPKEDEDPRSGRNGRGGERRGMRFLRGAGGAEAGNQHGVRIGVGDASDGGLQLLRRRKGKMDAVIRQNVAEQGVGNRAGRRIG